MSSSPTGLARLVSREPIKALAAAQRLLDIADVRIQGDRPWDLQIHHPDTLVRILSRGSLGLGESYMDGWWDCDQLDEFFARVLHAKLDEQVSGARMAWLALRARLFNLQTERRAWQVGREHYDLGNELFEGMLDPFMAYSCGYWAQATTLDDAQEAKLDLVCRKLGLKPGMTLLDIGCGWGSLMRFAAKHYGVQCTGLTISREQADWGKARARELPVQFELTDYRSFNTHGEQRFDRIASIGMFEHVGHKNYSAYFACARRSLSEDGLFLLHTIGKNRSGASIDPWTEKYIFPNGALPSVTELAEASEPMFVLEDWHNFGADYDRTLMAWHERFEVLWPSLKDRYGDRFGRMWRYYLLSCAGTFRARSNQLWQVVLSPRGVGGGYRRVS
ncbi:MAG: cyclopropane fatty acyl phospholipid synthase [Burkholderiaceae bacterium]